MSGTKDITVVDHGTAFGIAWQGIADEGSLTEAKEPAIRLASKGYPARSQPGLKCYLFSIFRELSL